MFCSMCPSREELWRIADAQAALRRVATLVARRAAPAEVLAAVTQEASAVFNADGALIVRHHPDGMSTVVARLGDDPNERSVDGLWRRVACPIVVGGRRWGAIAIASKHRGFPADTEERLADFTELVALAIANAEGADLFVSLHMNASPNGEAKGLETYYLDNTTDEASLRLAARENKFGYLYLDGNYVTESGAGLSALDLAGLENETARRLDRME